MAEERVNLAPTGIYGRSDEQFGWKNHRKSQEEPSKCLVYILATIVIVVGGCLILAQIIFRITTPKVELLSITVRNLRLGNSSSPFFNATLVNEIAIKNPNFGGFEFENSTGSVAYKNIGIVGEMKIVGGRVDARKTARLTGIQVEIASNSGNLSSDLGLGLLELRSVAEIKGRVNVMGRRRWKTGDMSCTMKLNLTGRFIQDLSCD
ncbi:PREDICTED: late embryogenesis abundant protein At1g64065-like [Tarenaya hassleriana]|uniref:late embryogenesis abundant protein At1g64065-like n=1 Tax=Tarenaya hassleriana TaxID=28532 RepID=UPI00053C1776|nr:PREDICTED: late embryogenesis abundant protein At1g64065-like [Tarenaya hassleriana]